MKVLICYNGSSIAQDAVGDLEYAGLPQDAEFDVLSVAELGPAADDDEDEVIRRACYARDWLTEHFRLQNVKGETSSGSASYEILNRSKSFASDLIVLGEERTPPDEHNMFLRSTCQKVLKEAGCSVRIARGNTNRDASPPRIVIGYDGSPGARTAVEAVAARDWAPHTQVRLVVVTDSAILSSIGRFSPQMTNPRFEAKIASQWANALAEVALKRLKEAGLDVTLCVESGNPKNVLVKLAESWNADSIFVGRCCLGNSFEPFLLGSVSETVAACAHCSVEVVRRPAVH